MLPPQGMKGGTVEELNGKVALVTGAGSGIGKATALALAAEGAGVVVADVADANGEETVRLIAEAGGRASFVHTDVARSDDVQALVRHALEVFGRLDCAVNNAGLGGELQFSTADYPEESWHRLIGINLTGVFLCMKYEIPELLKVRGGAVVNIASVMATVAMPGGSAYAASKHGVLGLTKAAALEYGPQGLRVNALCPGFIATPLISQAGIAEGSGPWETIGNLHALKRWGTAEEVAAAAVWLCSDKASFVTGSGMLIDGGYAAQ